MATDPYSHTQHIASAVLDELAKRSSCNVSPDVAREHGETLVTSGTFENGTIKDTEEGEVV